MTMTTSTPAARQPTPIAAALRARTIRRRATGGAQRSTYVPLFGRRYARLDNQHAELFLADGGASAYQNGNFSTGSFNGDGWQASHWKAPQLPSGQFSCALPKLGIENPYICSGRVGIVTGLDLAAYDAIGYNTDEDLFTYAMSTADIAYAPTHVPEPAAWPAMIGGFGMIGGALRRRRTGFATA